MIKFFCYILACAFISLSCNVQKAGQQQQTVGSIASLKLLGEYDLPHNQSFKTTTIGGLSGIDYDAANDLYYIISDDRSAMNPARFYTAKIFANSRGIDSVVFADVKYLRQKDSSVYPNKNQNPQATPDPEAIRYNSKTHELVWSSEGERIVNNKTTVLENPAITNMTAGGKYIDTFPLPPQLLMSAKEEGPRQNGVLEGLSFADNYQTLFASVEEPLYQDGPRAMLQDTTAWIRILKYNVAAKKPLAQYAYRLEPVAYAATPSDGFKINGVPDILWMGGDQLLVIERSYSTGRLSCTIRIFEADLHGATDIAGYASLKENKSFAPATKKLLLNMDSMGIYIDNVEGMTFGPTLPNGHKTLVLVSDNNFDMLEKTQFFLFEIME